MKNDVIKRIEFVLDHYDLGRLVDFEQNERGYCNISFAIDLEKNGEITRYFLREYKHGVTEQEVLFEHSLSGHLKKFPQLPVAGVYATKDGNSYLKISHPGQATPSFFTIFDFLPGEDRYTWVNPHCNLREIKNSASLLALFHQAVFGFQPLGNRLEPHILELLPVIDQNLERCVANTKGTVFDKYLQNNLPLVKEHLNHVSRTLTPQTCASMPRLIIHCDYHPGNLKFEGAKPVALFDFDWSKIDLRVFDVALACFYFFTNWDVGADGVLLIDDLAYFLTSYQETLKDSKNLTALDELELRNFPHMLAASNLYILNWTILDYLNKDVDAEEYLIYLRHAVNLITWLSQDLNWLQLEETTNQIGK